MRKQLLHLLLSTFLFSFTAIQIHAETAKWSDNVSEITPVGNVYNITSANELAWVAQEVNNGNLKNKIFILQADIDLKDKEWTPIGNSSSNAFTGYFRGDNHTISNLTITEQSSDYTGLFGNSKGDSGGSTEISDVTLANVNINNISFGAGTLIGNSFYTDVTNCHVKGSISTVCGNPVNVGGLIGYAQHTVVDGSSTEVTYTVVDYTGKKDYYSLSIGGITGSAVSGMTIQNSYSAGEIKRGTDDWSNNSLSTFNAGGLIGKVTEYYDYVVTNSFSTCSINISNFSTQSNSTEISVGGLVGYVNSPSTAGQSAKVAFSNSFYKGTITPLTTTSTVKSNNVGAIAGNGNSEMKFDNSFYPSGDMAAVGNNSPSSTTGLATIPDDLTTKLNEWVQTNNTKSDYLSWNIEGDVISIVPETLAEVDTDYAWEDNICTLKTKKGMLWFVDQVNKLYNTFEGKTVKLTKGDWDMTDKEWESIGLAKGSPHPYFSGTFDGNNQEVKIKIGTESEPINTTYMGFFGSIEDGNIQNLTVEGDIYNESGNSGIVVAKIKGGTISNVTSKGILSAIGTSVAGIAGNAEGCSITDCVNEAKITGKQYIGGIVGSFLLGDITGCTNSGDITGGAAVGGIIGSSEADAVIADCVNSGDIQATNSGPYIAGAGGIVGMLTTTSSQSSKDVIVINTINKGQVSVPNGLCAGGIVGIAGSSSSDKKDISFVSCGNYEKVSGSNYVSGIGTIQMTTGKSMSVENCFNIGEVTASNTVKSSLILRNGSNGSATLENSFYKEQEGLSAAMGTVNNQENISPTTADGSWLNQLNQYVDAYNAAHPDGPQANTWKMDENGEPIFGLPAPIIEGETSFTSRTTVTITTNGGASIYYTTDDSEPTTDNGTLYTSSFTLTETTTIKAIAVSVSDDKVSDPAVQVFTKRYVPPVIIPTYYTVTLPAVEGITLSQKAGDYTVEEGYSFSFGLTLDKDYSQSQPVVKANDVEITPRASDGKYVIRNIEEDILITIEGIVKDEPTANAVIGEEANRIYAVRNIVYIESTAPAEAQVVSIGGRVIRQLHIIAGTNQVDDLASGVYIIRLSDGRKTKVSVQ